MTQTVRTPPRFGAPRLHYEDTINADALSVREAILEIMSRLQAEFAEGTEGVISTEIVLAEVLNNIVEHSYEDTGMGKINMSVLCIDDMISIETRDFGVPMPGLELPEGAQEEVPVDLDDLPEGGFGWFFIRKLSEHMEYKRTGNQNIFCVQISSKE